MKVIQLAHRGFQWEAQPTFAPWLARVLGSPGRVVKESPVKTVTRHELDGRAFYIKRYRHGVVALRPLKFFFKPSQSRHEWRLANELTQRGIPIVTHLAHGERWTWRGLLESVLITENFDSLPVDEAPAVNVQAVLQFVQRMHDHGVVQRDLHPGNLLVAPATGELRLVDLHGIELKAVLSSGERDANLAFLRIFMPIPVAPEVERESARLRQAYLAYRSKRCLKHNREFEPRSAGGLRWWVRKTFLNPAVEEILRAPDSFLAGRTRLLKNGRASTVGLADNIVLKRYNLRMRKPENSFKDLFRRSKARNAFRKAYHLELAGIPTARPIATADRRWARFLLRSYLVMEAIPGAVDLGQWPGNPAHTLRCAAELVAKLHNEGFTHRDLKETNLVLDRDGRLFIIDLDGLEYLGNVPNGRAGTDIARFSRGVETLPRLRDLYRTEFLERYCRLRGLQPADVCSDAANA